MIFYGLKSCDACRRALRTLAAAGAAPEIRDVRADGPDAATLRRWIDLVGAEALVNRRSTTWRGLDEDARAACETPEGAVATLVAHPTLMKRPVIEAGGAVHVGWSAKVAAVLT